MSKKPKMRCLHENLCDFFKALDAHDIEMLHAMTTLLATMVIRNGDPEKWSVRMESVFTLIRDDVKNLKDQEGK